MTKAKAAPPSKPTTSGDGPDLKPGLLAKHVAASRYIFPRLVPSRQARWELALAGREECAADYLVDRESYPFHVVEVVTAGRGRVTLGRRRAQALGPGTVFAYAPDTVCRIETDPAQPLVKFFFALSGREVGTRLAEAQLPAGSVRRLEALSEVVSIAENILSEGQRHGPRMAEICLKWFELLLLKVQAGGDQRRVGTERARENFLRCRALIEANAAQLGTLEDAAKLAGLDPASVCRLFRRFQGTSPYQYLMRRKMMLAAQHLMDSDRMVKEAAALVGFADPYHFTRCFKSVHGVPPRAVRGYRLRS